MPVGIGQQHLAALEVLVREPGALARRTAPPTSPVAAAAAISAAASRGSTIRHGRWRARAVVPTTSPQSADGRAARRRTPAPARARRRPRRPSRWPRHRREALGRHQAQPLEAHVLHGARGRRRCCRGGRCRRGRCVWTCSGILAARRWTRPGRVSAVLFPAAEPTRQHAATAQHRRPRRAARRRPDRPQRGPRARRSACAPRAATTSSPRSTSSPSATSSRPSGAATPTTASSARSAGAAAATSSCGSSTRSTARRTSCTASRPSRCRSPASTAAGSSTRVVYDPMRQELFTASRGDGAQLDGRRIRVSKQPALEGALIGTGFPYRANARWIGRLPRDARGRDGADRRHPPPRRRRRSTSPTSPPAALDGFWEIGLNAWDTAAGTLLITEAGGRIGTLTGGEYRAGRQRHRRHAEGVRGAGRRPAAARARGRCARTDTPAPPIAARGSRVQSGAHCAAGRTPRSPRPHHAQAPVLAPSPSASCTRPTASTSCNARSTRAAAGAARHRRDHRHRHLRADRHGGREPCRAPRSWCRS